MKRFAFTLVVLGIVGIVVYLALTQGGRNTGARGASIKGSASDDVASLMQHDEATPPANPSNAQSVADVAISTYELDPELLHVVNMIGNGQFMEARANIALYVKHTKPTAPTEFLNGLSYQKELRYELARPFFESAIDMDPGYRPSWYFYGWCLYYLGEPEKSREAFEHHLKMDPLEGDSHYGIGLIDFDQGNLDAAEQEFRKAIELQQNNPRRRREVSKAHARLGDVFAARDQLDDAKRELVTATEMWPAHYEAHYKLARVLTRLGEDAAAAEEMAKFEATRRPVEGDDAPPSGIETPP